MASLFAAEGSTSEMCNKSATPLGRQHYCNEARSSVEEACAGGHAISRCDALAQASCSLAMFTGDWSMGEGAAAELENEATNHSLDPWKVLVQCWKAALLVRRGAFDP
ncbi:hypothetical protein [Rhodanobacter spathiphylli]|jgi:hypothetical protein|uniref:hypothetical protein n=1 Tax=Rhodanobacter TaxID=75309 RepID=UPI0012FC477B|nr:hypothetical protein [Rhodanobacter spathiphylli]